MVLRGNRTDIILTWVNRGTLNTLFSRYRQNISFSIRASLRAPDIPSAFETFQGLRPASFNNNRKETLVVVGIGCT